MKKKVKAKGKKSKKVLKKKVQRKPRKKAGHQENLRKEYMPFI